MVVWNGNLYHFYTAVRPSVETDTVGRDFPEYRCITVAAATAFPRS